jgi:N-acetylglucosaminyldiphosphoundecaprenol N-acetyl-beta-D-mannosaminyltransferase
MKINSFAILGVKINELTLDKTISVINYWIKNRIKNYIVLTGAHGIIEMHKDEELRLINNNAGLVTPDGMPEVWLGKLKGFKNIEKVYAPEIMEETFKVSVINNIKHFFYGGKEGVAEKLKIALEKKYPGIKVVGTYCPPFRPITQEEKNKIVKQINDSDANIVWCGLGCPKQELWMAQFRPLLNAPVLIGVGAGFDFLSGEKPLAPYWVTRSGFEWFYRIFSDPKRLIKRYSKIVPKFIFLNLMEILTGKFFKNNMEVK